jgi:hypothetical protein
MITAAARRRAVTLTEVLIAIFLMGIGLMAILSLFPLGAAQMAQAIKDQRAAEAATNASAMARVVWNQACDDDINTARTKFSAADTRPMCHQRFLTAMDDPSYNPADANFGIGPPDAVLGQPVPDYNANSPVVGDPNFGASVSAMPTIPRSGHTGASYPVFVDPIGWLSNAIFANGQPTRQHKWWLPTAPNITTNNGVRLWRIPRRTLYIRSGNAWQPITLPGNGQRLFKQFSLMDDMAFNFNGTPDLDANPNTADPPPALPALPPPVNRQGKYTWAYLYRRPGGADRTLVDISVIVYSGRSIDVPSREVAYQGSGVTGSKTLALAYVAPDKPAVRRGQWILDATLWDANGGLDPQGRFYRVVNVDDTTAGTLVLELQTPLLGGPFDPNRPLRSIIVMDNVVEVFTRTDVSAVSPPLPY